MIARDFSDQAASPGKSSASTIARQANAAAGGPLMTPDELDDPIETLDAMPCSTSTAPACRSELVNVAINDAIERAAATRPSYRVPISAPASSATNACAKFNTTGGASPRCHLARGEIFERGHYFEDVARQHLIAAGFKFAPPEALAFTAVNGDLRGHADGIIIAGPNR